MENQLKMKLRFLGTLPDNSKTLFEGNLHWILRKSGVGSASNEIIEARKVEFEYDCIIQPIYSDTDNVVFSQFEELEVKGYQRIVRPNFPPSLEQENEQLKVRVFELEQELLQRK